MRFPARNVKLPIIARYFRVWNMSKWVQYTYIKPNIAASE